MTKLTKIHLDKMLICSKLVGTLGCLTKVLKHYFYEFDSQPLVEITIYSAFFLALLALACKSSAEIRVLPRKRCSELPRSVPNSWLSLLFYPAKSPVLQ